MNLEHKMVAFPIDQEQQGKLEALEREGYQLIPGIPPVAVYHLVRPVVSAGAAVPQAHQEEPSGGGMGTLVIDESKIFVKKSR